MKTYHIELSRTELHKICNSLNTEAHRFNNLAADSSFPETARACFVQGAEEHNALTRKLVGIILAEKDAA